MKMTRLEVIFLALSIFIATSVSSAQNSRMQEHIDFITDPALLGRKAGSEGERAVADYVYKRMKEYGLEMFTGPDGQDFSIVRGQDTVRSRNIVGLVNGSDSLLTGRYIVVGANMDHLGVNVLTVDGRPVQQIFPGANNNASGLACLLELADMVQRTSFLFRRSVVFVAFGAKEQTMAGAWYFVNKAFPFIKETDMMVNLLMMGRSGSRNRLSYSTVKPNNDVDNLLKRMEDEYSMKVPERLEKVIPSSDFLAFYEKGLPVILFTTGSFPENNSVNDSKQYLDIESMEFHTQYLYSLLLEFANSDERLDGDSFMPDTESEEGVYVFTDVDEPPTFYKGSVYKFMDEWVYHYLRYPENAVESGIQGTVYVEFIIDTDGTLRNAKVVQGVDELLDKEALRVINASPKWKAGKMAGQKVKVKYTVPVEFRLRKR